MATPDVTVRLTANVSGWIAGMQKAIAAAAEFEREQAALRYVLNEWVMSPPWPMPPPPKTKSGMTAREYRAARRRYGRELRSLRMAL